MSANSFAPHLMDRNDESSDTSTQNYQSLRRPTIILIQKAIPNSFNSVAGTANACEPLIVHSIQTPHHLSSIDVETHIQKNVKRKCYMNKSRKLTRKTSNNHPEMSNSLSKTKMKSFEIPKTEFTDHASQINSVATLSKSHSKTTNNIAKSPHHLSSISVMKHTQSAFPKVKKDVEQELNIKKGRRSIKKSLKFASEIDTTLKKQMNYCQKITKNMFTKKHRQYAWPFYKPVEVKKWGLYNYHEIIKIPMDLSTVQQKLDNNEYESPQEYASDMRLIFTNCYSYNSPNHAVVVGAKKLHHVFENQYSKVPYIHDPPQSTALYDKCWYQLKEKFLPTEIKSLHAQNDNCSEREEVSSTENDATEMEESENLESKSSTPIIHDEKNLVDINDNNLQGEELEKEADTVVHRMSPFESSIENYNFTKNKEVTNTDEDAIVSEGFHNLDDNTFSKSTIHDENDPLNVKEENLSDDELVRESSFMFSNTDCEMTKLMENPNIILLETSKKEQQNLKEIQNLESYSKNKSSHSSLTTHQSTVASFKMFKAIKKSAELREKLLHEENLRIEEKAKNYFSSPKVKSLDAEREKLKRIEQEKRQREAQEHCINLNYQRDVLTFFEEYLFEQSPSE